MKKQTETVEKEGGQGMGESETLGRRSSGPMFDIAIMRSGKVAVLFLKALLSWRSVIIGWVRLTSWYR